MRGERWKVTVERLEGREEDDSGKMRGEREKMTVER